VDHCSILQDILVTLDLICSKLQIKHGELKPNQRDLWSEVGISFMPKIHHGALAHAMQQAE